MQRLPALLLVLLLLAAGLPATTERAGAPAVAIGGRPGVVDIDAPRTVLPALGANRTVSVVVSLEDPDGWQDIRAVHGVVLDPDGAVHRPLFALSPLDDGDGRKRAFAGTFVMAYHDAPAEGARTYALRVFAYDQAGNRALPVHHEFFYGALAGVGTDVSELSFGQVRSDAPTEPTALSVRNLGNIAIDLEVAGTALVHERGAELPVETVSYALDPTAFGQHDALSESPATITSFDLAPGEQAHRPLWWRLGPVSFDGRYLPAGAYHGSVRLGALADPGGGVAACRDGLDNDDDGRKDHPSDPGCATPEDPSERVDQETCALVVVDDPGFAYEDVDNNGAYTNGTDLVIPAAQLRAGGYQVPPERPGSGLVVPASVGAVARPGGAVTLRAGASGDLHLQVDLNATTVLLGAGGAVWANGTTLRSISGTVTIHGERLGLGCTTVGAEKAVDITAWGNTTWADHALWQSQKGDITLKSADGGSWRHAQFHTARSIHIEAGGHVDARGLKLLAGRSVDVAGSASWWLHGAETDVGKGWTWRSAGLDAPWSVWTSDGTASWVVEGPIDLQRAHIDARDSITASATGALRLTGSEITSARDIAVASDAVVDAMFAGLYAGGISAGLPGASDEDDDDEEEESSGSEEDGDEQEKRDEDDEDDDEDDDGDGSGRGGRGIWISSGGGIHATCLRSKAVGTVDIRSTGDLLVPCAEFSSQNGPIHTEGGPLVDAGGASFHALKGVTVAAAGDLRLPEASLVAPESHIVLRLGGAAARLSLDGALFLDRDNSPRIEPEGVAVHGTPREAGGP